MNFPSGQSGGNATGISETARIIALRPICVEAMGGPDRRPERERLLAPPRRADGDRCGLRHNSPTGAPRHADGERGEHYVDLGIVATDGRAVTLQVGMHEQPGRYPGRVLLPAVERAHMPCQKRDREILCIFAPQPRVRCQAVRGRLRTAYEGPCQAIRGSFLGSHVS